MHHDLSSIGFDQWENQCCLRYPYLWYFGTPPNGSTCASNINHVLSNAGTIMGACAAPKKWSPQILTTPRQPVVSVVSSSKPGVQQLQQQVCPPKKMGHSFHENYHGFSLWHLQENCKRTSSTISSKFVRTSHGLGWQKVGCGILENWHKVAKSLPRLPTSGSCMELTHIYFLEI